MQLNIGRLQIVALLDASSLSTAPREMHGNRRYDERRVPREQITMGRWPAQPPVLRALAPVGALRVPLGIRADAETIAIPNGSVVERGQPLATTVPADSHMPLSPIAGRVVKSEHVGLFNGKDAPALELEPLEGNATPEPWPVVSDEAAESKRASELLNSIGKSDLPVWIDRLRDAGIGADRRCSPDLIGQLHVALRRPIDSVICNMLDGDPNSCILTTLAAHYPTEVAIGTALLAKLTGARHNWLVGEAGAPASWWGALRRIARCNSLRLLTLTNDYPQSDPTLLLYTLLDRRLRPGRPPVEQGVIMIDAGAALAIGQLVCHGRPMLETPLVIRDHARRESIFLRVPIGMSLEQIIPIVRVPTERLTIRAGDVLRDEEITASAVAGTGELVLHATFAERSRVPDPCIRCGWCLEMCPTRIHPAGLLEAAQRRDLPLAESHGLEACIECGICSYVCPSHLPLLEGIRSLKEK